MSVTRCFAALCLIAMVTPTVDAKGKRQSPQPIWNHAFEQVALRASTPFQLDAEVQLTGATGETPVASYREKHFAPDEARIEIQLPGYNFVQVETAGQRWTAASEKRTPLRAIELQAAFERLLDPANLEKGVYEWTKDVFTVEGRELRCVVKRGARKDGIVCVDESNGLPYFVRKWPWQFEFSDYQAVGSKLFPRRVRILEGDSVVLDMRVTVSLAMSSDPTTALAPPPNSEYLPCIPKDREGYRSYENRGIGTPNAKPFTVVLQGTVQKTGRVRDSVVLLASNQSLLPHAKEAFLWVRAPYKPCGKSIETEGLLIYTFWQP